MPRKRNNAEYLNRFLNVLDFYLNAQGQQTNSIDIRLQCKSLEEVSDYLSKHGYSRAKSSAIVAEIKRKIK